MVDRIQFDRHYNIIERQLKDRGFEEFRISIEKAYSFAYNKKINTVIDIGCYSGGFHLAYGKYFSKIILADVIDQRASKVIELFPFKQIDLDSSLGEDAGKYDFINLIEVIEHLPNLQRGMLNIRTLLNEGGYVLITTPNRLRIAERIKNLLGRPTQFPTKGDLYGIHYREFSLPEILGLLQQFHFKVEFARTVLAGIGKIYFPFCEIFPAGLKKNIIILAHKF